MYQITFEAMGLRSDVRLVETPGFDEITVSPLEAVVWVFFQSHDLCVFPNILTRIWIEVWSI